MRRHALLVFALFAAACAEDPAGPSAESPDLGRDRGDEVAFWLTVLHNNDGESDLINAGSGALADFGGIARFATLARQLREEATGPRSGAILVSAGDNFLAGPELNASLTAGVFYDAIGLDQVGYDAFIIGNHEFDFGPELLADFVETFRDRRPPVWLDATGADAALEGDGPSLHQSDDDSGRHGGFALFRLPVEPAPFLSANLGFGGEPRLRSLVADRRIAPSAIVFVRGRKIGLVGATTPDLPFISSPRNVEVDPDIAAAVQEQIDRLERAGADIIVVVSHLQTANRDIELVAHLDGVDIAVAGGGDELLANPGDLLVPGSQPSGRPYPIMAFDRRGREVPVVTTEGGYRYIGRLKAGFDRQGNLVAIDAGSGPVRVAGGANPDAVAADPEIQAAVVDPVAASVAALGATVIATSEVALEGRRPAIRVQETNEGNLVADALRWQATQLAAEFRVPVPDVAVQNGGGIRNNSLIPSGNITELNTFEILPFSNFLAVAPSVPRAQFREIMENAVSRVANVDGRWAHVSGFSFVWSPAGTPQVLDAAGNVTTPGTRIVSITLDNGTAIVANGEVVDGAPLTVATIDFLARGGDQYPFRDTPFTVLGTSYQRALFNYITSALAGVISAADYPEGGEGRITTPPVLTAVR